MKRKWLGVCCLAVLAACGTVPRAQGPAVAPLPVKQATANMRALTILVDRNAELDVGSTSDKPGCTKGGSDSEHHWDLEICIPAGGKERWVDAFTNALKRAGFQVTHDRMAPYDLEWTPALAVSVFQSLGAERTLKGEVPYRLYPVYWYQVELGQPKITEGLRKNDSGGWQSKRKLGWNRESKALSAVEALGKACQSGKLEGVYSIVTTIDDGFQPEQVAAHVVNDLATCDAFEAFATLMVEQPSPAGEPTAIAQVKHSEVPPTPPAVPKPTAEPTAKEIKAPPTAPAVSYVAGTPQPASYAFIVGVEHYRDVPEATGARNDVRAFEQLVRRTLGLPDDHVRVAAEDRATRADVLGGLRWLKDTVPAGGRVYFYFSGHGAPATNQSTWLLPYDGNPRDVQGSAVAMADVMSMLGSSRAREVLVVVDSCFSGAGGRSVLPPGARPLMRVRESTPSPQMALFTASQGDEISGPGSGTMGAFTQQLAEALGDAHADGNGDGQISLLELKEWVTPRVAREAKKQNREQHPNLVVGSGLGSATNFVVAYGLPTH